MAEHEKERRLEDVIEAASENQAAENAPAPTAAEESNEPVTSGTASEAVSEEQTADPSEPQTDGDAAESPTEKAGTESAAMTAAESPEPVKKSESVSRGDLLKKRLVDQYMADKGGDSASEEGEKKQEGKLEKAAKFGGVLDDLAENYDNSKSFSENADKVGSAFSKVYGGKSQKKENDGEKQSSENKKAESDDPAEGSPKTDTDKAADKAVKEIVEKGDKDGGSEETLQKVVKEVSKSDDKTSAQKKEETEQKKQESRQGKTDRLVGEAAAAIHDRAVEEAGEGGAPQKGADKGSEDAEKSEKDKEGEDQKDGEKKQEETPLPVKEMLGDLSGGYKNTVGAVASLYSAKRSKSRRSKVRGRIRGAQQITGAVGNASNLVGTLLASGKVGSGTGIRIASGTLGAVSGGMQAVSSVLGIVGDKKARKQSAEIAGKTGSLAGSDKYAASDASAEVRKLKALRGKSDPDKYEKDLAAAKKKRDSAKANKLAMAIASKFNKNKSETSTKGIGGLISGIGKMWDGISNAAGIAGGGFIKDILSPIIKKGSEFAQSKLDERDKQNEEKEKQKDDSMRLETIQEYLAGKREKIKSQAKGLSAGQDLSDEERKALSGELTDNEADKIALMRLGVSVADISSDKPASDAAMMEGFEKVIMKRANNILRSDNKDEMLDALMLSHDATAEDIAKALKGE